VAVALSRARRRTHVKAQPRAATSCRAYGLYTDEEAAGLAEASSSATVKKTSVLVLGSTGTLGRQVVRQFLNAGCSVKCMIRNKADRPFSFLIDWGATVIEGSLLRPETLPSALVGVHTVIDCATARPEESIYDVDWKGKKRLIQCCKAMEIQRYIFMSIKDCEKYEDVPLMQIKNKTEQFLKQVGLRYTVLRATGFMQPLVSQYALSILDEQQVYADDGTSPGIAYIDSQDTARMIAAAINREKTVGQTLNVSGPQVWNTSEVIKLCEELAGREADVNTVSSLLIKLTQVAAGSFEWSADIAERLRFVEVNSASQSSKDDVMTGETYQMLGMDPSQTRNLEEYFKEFYRRVFKKISFGKYEPEAGEKEREEEEDKAKLEKVLAKDEGDFLPPGQPAEVEVSILSQRDTADRLQQFFEDIKLDELEGEESKWFGLTPVAEVINGRSAMFGFSLGLFTEWATGVSFPKQIDQLFAVFGSPS